MKQSFKEITREKVSLEIAHNLDMHRQSDILWWLQFV